jgi:uncharacterized protein (DUF1778 family)
MSLKERKSEKFDIRLSASEQQLINAAARLKHTTPTNFIRAQALAAAEQLVQQQTRFVLTKDQWDELDRIFAEEPKVLPNLRSMMNEPDEWDA